MSNHTAVIAWADPQRHLAFDTWLESIRAAHGLQPRTLSPASADASFRRYLRIDTAAGSRVIMDAPPPHEDVRPFVQIAQSIRAAGLNAPRVLACDVERGFVLLDDLGTELYLGALQGASAARADALMRDAIAALVQWQCRMPVENLPAYDEALLARELALFPDWCVQHEFGRTWSDDEQACWQRICRLLIDSALAQPQVVVHRDTINEVITRHQWLTDDGLLERTVLSDGTETLINQQDSPCDTLAGGMNVRLGAYGFFVRGRTMIAFLADRVGDLDLGAPTWAVVRRGADGTAECFIDGLRVDDPRLAELLDRLRVRE
jgi:hypothetical protein